MSHPQAGGGVSDPTRPPTQKQKKAKLFFRRLWRQPTHAKTSYPRRNHHSHCIGSGVRKDMLRTIEMNYNIFIRH